MGRHHDDDDDDSIWDDLMKPASMDYNGDGKIDDYDRYIELDELDKALGGVSMIITTTPMLLPRGKEKRQKNLKTKTMQTIIQTTTLMKKHL